MHDIEPHYHWRDRYVSEEDSRSPFFGQEHSEFQFSQKVYNYFIHPQWDAFGSQTLYGKLIFADYDKGYAILELIGEWNDCIANDVMYLKREVIDPLVDEGIFKFIVICESVLNFHGSDDCYYEEWYEDVRDDRGWICFLNTLEHVQDEMQSTQIQQHVNMGDQFNDVNWRPYEPKLLLKVVESLIFGQVRQLGY